MPKIPYWLAINSNYQDDIAESDCFSFFSTGRVSSGDSPLFEHGKIFIEMLYSSGFPADDKIWIFPKNALDNKYSHQVGNLFVLISRIKSDNALSRHGTVTIDDSGDYIDWQPPNPDIQESVFTIRPLLPVEVDATFLLARDIAEHSLYDKCFHQLNYLKELRCTDPFLGYLGLWSFIEIEWADDPQKTLINKSLKNILENVFHNQKEAKKKFNQRLKDISAAVGKSVGEYSIRNLLAHGKYHKVLSEWDEETNKEFHAVHDELFKIMITGLEAKIRKNARLS